MKIIVYPLNETMINQDTFIDINAKLDYNDAVVLPKNLLKCDKSTMNKIYELLHKYELEMTVRYDKYPNTEKIFASGYTILTKIRKSEKYYEGYSSF
jgi:hypothetical protein